MSANLNKRRKTFMLWTFHFFQQRKKKCYFLLHCFDQLTRKKYDLIFLHHYVYSIIYPNNIRESDIDWYSVAANVTYCMLSNSKEELSRSDKFPPNWLITKSNKHKSMIIKKWNKVTYHVSWLILVNDDDPSSVITYSVSGLIWLWTNNVPFIVSASREILLITWRNRLKKL